MIRPAKDILREAGESGLTRNLLYAARKVEGVHSGKERVPGGRWVRSSSGIAAELLGLPDPHEVREVREVRQKRDPTNSQ
jgi:hypothetical protein